MPLLRVLLCALLVAGYAHAQVRSIPFEAKRGEMRHVHDMIVAIDGKNLRLAPGAQIRDQSNRLLLPIALPPGAKVKYLLNGEGQVRRAWILTPEEAAAKP